MAKIKHKFIRIYWVSFKVFNLTPTELLFLNLIKGLSNNQYRACFASKKALANDLNIAVSTVYTVITSLKKKGLLNSKRISMKASHLFTTRKWQAHIELVRAQNEPAPEGSTDSEIDDWFNIDPNS